MLLAADGRPHPRVRGATLCAQTEDGGGSASILVDLARVPEMNRLEYDERNGLVVGTAVLATEPLGFPPVGRLRHLGRRTGRGRARGRAAGRHAGRVAGRMAPGGEPAGPADLSGGIRRDLRPPRLVGDDGRGTVREATWHGAAPRGIPGRRPAPAPFPRSGGAYLRSASAGIDGGAAGVGAFLLMEDDRVTCCGARVTVWDATAAPSGPSRRSGSCGESASATPRQRVPASSFRRVAGRRRVALGARQGGGTGWRRSPARSSGSPSAARKTRPARAVEDERACHAALRGGDGH